MKNEYRGTNRSYRGGTCVLARLSKRRLYLSQSKYKITYMNTERKQNNLI